MNRHDVEELLRQTLVDHAVTGDTSVTDAMQRAVHDERRREETRRLAFRIAREALGDRAAVLDWLSVVDRALQPASTAGGGHGSEVLFSPGQQCTQRVIALLGEARHSIDLCVFTITDDRITRAILAAHQRRVAIRLITDDEKARDLGSDILRLRQAGLAVRVDAALPHMHHKFGLFDDRLVCSGSFNWTRSAADFNWENLVVSSDPNLLTGFRREFERLWAAFEGPAHENPAP